MSWLANRRRGVGKKESYLMTTETNPQVLAICYAKGWCANQNYMTYEEAAAVTSFAEQMRFNTTITHFEELEYFVKITSCPSFYGCTNLTTIKLPLYCRTIGDQYFRNCSKLKSIFIPATIQTISQYAFHTCSQLTSVYIYAETPPTLGTGAFLNVSPSLKIYVPANSVSAYKAASSWSSYSSKIYAIPT